MVNKSLLTVVKSPRNKSVSYPNYQALGFNDELPFGKYRFNTVYTILKYDEQYIAFMYGQNNKLFKQEVVDLLMGKTIVDEKIEYVVRWK